MNSCIIFCSETLKKAQEGLKRTKRLYKDEPIGIPFVAVVNEANIDVMYPYWFAVIFNERLTNEIDKWIYKAHIPAGEVCVGVPRLRELLTMSKNLESCKFKGGKVDTEEVTVSWEDD